jgi:hypothetical protein
MRVQKFARRALIAGDGFDVDESASEGEQIHR